MGENMSYVSNYWEEDQVLDLNKFLNIEQGVNNISLEKESVDNKVIFIDENSTDEEYPSAKAVYALYKILLGLLPDKEIHLINNKGKVAKIFNYVPDGMRLLQ